MTAVTIVRRRKMRIQGTRNRVKNHWEYLIVMKSAQNVLTIIQKMMMRTWERMRKMTTNNKKRGLKMRNKRCMTPRMRKSKKIQAAQTMILLQVILKSTLISH